MSELCQHCQKRPATIYEFCQECNDYLIDRNTMVSELDTTPIAELRYQYIGKLEAAIREACDLLVYQDTSRVFHCHYCGASSTSRSFLVHGNRCVVMILGRAMHDDPDV